MPDAVGVYGLAVEPAKNARPDYCTDNTAAMVDEFGGSVEYGWQIWETFPRILMEAEFHAVWVNPAGERHDVTPKPPWIDHIVFLPDPALEYKGQQIDSHRLALKRDPLVDALIRAKRDFFEVTNRGELADFHGDLRLTPEMLAIQRRVMVLEQKIARKYYGVDLAA